MTFGRKHLFHIVEFSAAPIISAFCAFFFLSYGGFYMHHVSSSGYLLLFSLILLIFSVFSWYGDIVNEASFRGNHTLVVRRGLKYGFYLFVVSEIMLFFGFFWAFFHSSYNPTFFLNEQWTPDFIIETSLELPLYNTMLLITSGFAVTVAHRYMALGKFYDACKYIVITVIFGLFFLYLQLYEYNELPLDISRGVFPSTFFMLTGLHGMHVLVGVIFLFTCFLRLLWKHFTVKHYAGFMFAIWYWHFVDIVWILLFFIVYVSIFQ